MGHELTYYVFEMKEYLTDGEIINIDKSGGKEEYQCAENTS